MAILDVTMTNYAFKAMLNKTRGSNSVAFYEEIIPRLATVHANKIWTESIPSIAPLTDTSIVKVYTQLPLTLDRSVPGNRKWVALPTFSSSWSSGSATNVGDIITNWIEPMYGVTYSPQIYNGAGAVIPELDASDWVFDKGVLVFNSADRSETGSSVSQAIKLTACAYIGKTLMNGAPSNLSQFMTRQELGSNVGDKDGLIKTFALPSNINLDLLFHVYFNSVLLFPNLDYTIDVTNKTITLEVAPQTYDSLNCIFYPTA